MNDDRTFLTRWRLSLFFFLLASFMGSANADTAVNKTWSVPEILAHSTLDFAGTFTENRVGQSKIITNTNGKAFVVWTEYNDVGSFDAASLAPKASIEYSYWSSYFDGTNWNNPVRVRGISVSENTTLPEIIFDGNGNVLATWTESSTYFTKIFASYFDGLKREWGSPTQLAYDDSGIKTSLEIVLRNNAIVHVVWEQHKRDSDNQFSSTGLWSSAFNGSSWNNPIQIYESRTIKEYRTKTGPIFSNYNNDLMSVYLAESDDDYMMGVFASHFDGSNWSAPQRLGSDSIYASDIKAGFDKNGNAIAVWQEMTVDYRELFLASHFNRSSRTWSPAVIIAENKGGYSPQIAFNDNGYAFVAWQGSVWQEYVQGEDVLWVSQFNGNNWKTPFRIDSVPWRGGTIKVRDVTLDNSNLMHVAWLKSVNNSNALRANSFNFDGNPIGSAKSIDVGKDEIIDTPSDIPLKTVKNWGIVDIAIDINGNAYALSERIVSTWEREEPNSSSPWKETKTQTIWTSQLKAKAPLPIIITQAFIFEPYGSFLILEGGNFTGGTSIDFRAGNLNGGIEYNYFLDQNETSGLTLVDENGNPPLTLYAWQDGLVAALFNEDPKSVTLTTPVDTITIPIVARY